MAPNKDSKNMKKKALSALAVMAMFAMAFMPMAETMEASTTDYWYCTVSSDGVVEYNGSTTTAAGYAGNEGSYTSSSHTNVGSWDFREDGSFANNPFGSFYAAFDACHGNKLICCLNPMDLTESLDEDVSLDDYTDHIVNKMWILPTIYWSVGDDGSLNISNDPSKGVAYAHTIDGTVYPYLAIGVYEGTQMTTDAGDILTSASGQQPTYCLFRSEYRTMANAQTVATEDGSTENGHAMLWNIYMWQLYRYCVIIAGNGFDSQAAFGNGDVYMPSYRIDPMSGTSYYAENGSLDKSGPYAGQVGDSELYYYMSPVKAFIENAWGTFNDCVDGVLIYNENDGMAVYANQSSKPTDIVADYTALLGYLPNTSGYGTTMSISQDNPAFWGLPTATVDSVSDSESKDYCLVNSSRTTTYPSGLTVGGYSNLSESYSSNAGISYIDASSWYSDNRDFTVGRLAFVFDADIVEKHTVTFMSDPDKVYETVSVPDGSVVSAPTSPTKNAKVFSGWYTDATYTTKYEFDDPVTSNLILYAQWYSLLEFTTTPDADGIFAYVNG